MMTVEDQKFLEAIRHISPSREMTKDPLYIVRRCCEINPDLKALVNEFNTPEQIMQLAQEIDATPEAQKIADIARQFGESAGYDISTFLVNLCAVCEDVLVGRIPLPTDLAEAIKQEYVKNVRAMEVGAK